MPFRAADCGFCVCGPVCALSVTSNVPVAVPVCVGVNTTSMVQLAREVKVDLQVVEETLKGPVVEITIFVNWIVWLLVSLNAFAALIFPTLVFG